MAGRVETGTELIARLAKKTLLEGKLEAFLFPSGPPPKSIIELYGEEGTGKTQMLMHLIANCILPKQWNDHVIGGLEVSVIFVDTDFDMSLIRLVNMIDCRITRCLRGSKDDEAEADEPIDNDDMNALMHHSLTRLHLVRCKSSSQLFITLDYLDNLLTKKPDIGVLMIDSISAFYWIDKYAGGDSVEAQELNMTRIASVLQKLTNTHNLVVFATKNVLYQKPTQSPTTEHCEYLCKAWSKIITQRLIFSKESGQSSGSDKEHHFSVSFESSSGTTKRNFKIDETGVVF